MTTAEIVRHYRDRGQEDLLLSQLHTLPKGEQISIESCIAGKVSEDDTITWDKNECQDIANEMCGI
jgi:hypothetical protein